MTLKGMHTAHSLCSKWADNSHAYEMVLRVDIIVLCEVSIGMWVFYFFQPSIMLGHVRGAIHL